jgi:hypothetical protein
LLRKMFVKLPVNIGDNEWRPIVLLS